MSTIVIHGTDQMGYAQVADWMRLHPVDEVPRVDREQPYESYPEWARHGAHRSGAYLLLASLSWLRGCSGLFRRWCSAAWPRWSW